MNNQLGFYFKFVMVLDWTIVGFKVGTYFTDTAL